MTDMITINETLRNRFHTRLSPRRLFHMFGLRDIVFKASNSFLLKQSFGVLTIRALRP